MDLEKYKSGASPQEGEGEKRVVKMQQAKPFQYEKPVNVQKSASQFRANAAASRGVNADVDEFITKKQAYEMVKQNYRDTSGSSNAGLGAIAQQLHAEWTQRENQNRQIQEAAAKRRAEGARQRRQMSR